MSEAIQLDEHLGHKGDRVFIHGLVLRADLNGQAATLIRFDDTERRWAVEVSDSHKKVRVRPVNLVTAKDRALTESMHAVFPQLWQDGKLKAECAISTPLIVDGESMANLPINRPLALDPDQYWHYKGGHELELKDGRLGWMMTTVEDCRVKWSFVAIFETRCDSLCLVLHKVNGFLAGISRNPRSERDKILDAYQFLTTLLAEKGSTIKIPFSPDERRLMKERMSLLNRNLADQMAHPERHWDEPPEKEDEVDVMASVLCPTGSLNNIDVIRVPPRPPAGLVPITRDFMRGEVVNGAVFVVKPMSQPKQQPMYLVHRLTISDAARGYGLADRVLLSTLPDCHDSSSFAIVTTVEECRLTRNACWVDLPENVVLGMFFQQTFDLPDERLIYGKEAPTPTVSLPPYMM